ncbi:hypothetical protein NADFUDRAFT_81622 [Nadsonia fulvescens var. elongata DSM 6958]|uniref:Ubiquitin-like domain-containing protein n=1 Tax=Nadsonia fulvescens var. elongata DSM 6958 TaxID=857566 RepID=A0A1E3PQ06_9ASCO|nr:hypothetical protein NADFUDRAFT_81622 [Nadsonia fulvescens var. elongata DSM 6958]
MSSTTTVATSGMDEESFASAFVNLLTATTSVQYDHNYCPNATELSSGPVILAKMPHPKKKKTKEDNSDGNKSNSNEPGTIKLTFKSIRAPKFSFTINDRLFSQSETVYSVKAALVASPEFPIAEIDLSQSIIKLLIRGKVIPDDKTLGDLLTDSTADAVSFMVMVSSNTSVTSSAVVSTSDPASPVLSDQTNVEVNTTDIDDALWVELEKTIASRYPLGKARAIASQLRTKWIE